MIIRNIAIVLIGSLMMGFLLVLSVPSFEYTFLFAISIVVAVPYGLSAPQAHRQQAENRSAGTSAEKPFIEDNNTEKTHYLLPAIKVKPVGIAVVVFGSLLAASTMLYSVLNNDLMNGFCIPTYGEVGDLKIDDNDYCNYAYGKMVRVFCTFLIVFLAPFLVFVALTVMLRAFRFSFFPFVKNWVKKH